MSRLLGWVKGEGTVKNQRWGLGAYPNDMIPYGTGGMGFTNSMLPFSVGGLGAGGSPTADELAAAGLTNTTFASAMTELNGPGYGPSMSTSYGDYGIYSNVLPTGGQTLGQWMQANSMLLLIGGVVGLLMFRRG